MKYTVLIFIVGMLSYFFMGVLHEQVHVEIYKGYGIDTEVKYFSEFPDMVTIAEERCPTEECELANNINEAITYPLTAVFAFIIVFAVMVINILEEKLW